MADGFIHGCENPNGNMSYQLLPLL